MTPLKLGIVATKAAWSAQLRSFVRDHAQGIEAEVLLDKADLRRALSRIDVLVLDDVIRALSPADLAMARDAGVHVIGLFDPGVGMGHRYLLELGVDEALPASTLPSELLALISRAKPSEGTAGGGSLALAGERRTLGRESVADKAGGLVAVWAKVSGGAGLTEAVVAAAEHLSRRARVLLVEAEDLSPVLVSRLRRSSEGGLPWALSRARQGLPALPGGLSAGRDDGARPLGAFDAVCAVPGAAQGIGGPPLGRLLTEASSIYDYVIVEAGWLATAPSVREHHAAARALLERAGALVVFAGADPEGASRLVQWKALAFIAGVVAPCWGVFGRARKSAYENGELRCLVEANSGEHPFAGFAFLSEDRLVARARWNAELTRKGPWHEAVRELADASCAGCGCRGPAAGRRDGKRDRRRAFAMAGARKP
jgi:hypothetical protein